MNDRNKLRLSKEQVDRVKGLEGTDGILRADDIVSDARKPKSPLHELFEWDDAKAAHDARMGTARRIVQSVYLEVTYENTTLRVPAYVHRPGEASENGYVAMASMPPKSDDARRAVLDALGAAHGHMERAKRVAAALGFGEHIDALLAQIERTQQSIEAAA